MDYAQEMSEGKEDEMDAETCSESFQDCDIDSSEFPGCRVGVEDLLITLLSVCCSYEACGLADMRMLAPKVLSAC